MEAIKSAAPLEQRMFEKFRAKFSLKQIYEYNEITQAIYNVHCGTDNQDRVQHFYSVRLRGLSLEEFNAMKSLASSFYGKNPMTLKLVYIPSSNIQEYVMSAC